MHLNAENIDMQNGNTPDEKNARTNAESSSDKDIEKALKSIHQKYGDDFQAFLRDVKETLRKQHASDNRADSFSLK